MMKKNDQRGVALPLVLILITIVTVLVMSYTRTLTSIAQLSLQDEAQEQLRALAEGGVDYELVRLKQGHKIDDVLLKVGESRIKVELKYKKDRYYLTSTAYLPKGKKTLQGTILVVLNQQYKILQWLEMSNLRTVE